MNHKNELLPTICQDLITEIRREHFNQKKSNNADQFTSMTNENKKNATILASSIFGFTNVFDMTLNEFMMKDKLTTKQLPNRKYQSPRIICIFSQNPMIRC